jgi:hypothetical protein
VVVIPHSVWRTGRDDHHTPPLEDVFSPRHAASHGALDNFQTLFLMRVYVIPWRGRDDARDILASEEFAGGLLCRFEDDHSVLCCGTIRNLSRHDLSPLPNAALRREFNIPSRLSRASLLTAVCQDNLAERA